MNQYTINSIDPITKAVYAYFEYESHTLNETVFVDDVTDADEITLAIDIAYSNFMAQMDKLGSAPDLNSEVQTLIGSIQSEAQVLKNVKVSPQVDKI
jgi:hypothetical protein